jgi:hypothetical protein
VCSIVVPIYIEYNENIEKFIRIAFVAFTDRIRTCLHISALFFSLAQSIQYGWQHLTKIAVQMLVQLKYLMFQVVQKRPVDSPRATHTQ